MQHPAAHKISLPAWLPPALLALALVRPVQRMEEEARSTGLLGATWHIYAIVLVAAFAGGAFIQSMCPGVKTLGEAITRLF